MKRYDVIDLDTGEFLAEALPRAEAARLRDRARARGIEAEIIDAESQDGSIWQDRQPKRPPAA